MSARDQNLLKTARELVQSNKNKPRQSNLLRAVSTAYYALFHALARCCADTVIGGAGSERSNAAWTQTYRALEHGFCKKFCKSQDINKFPQEIQDFAALFVAMQEKRHKADYDPNEKARKSAVLLDIAQTEVVINGFGGASLSDRRAFAAFVLFKKR